MVVTVVTSVAALLCVTGLLISAGLLLCYAQPAQLKTTTAAAQISKILFMSDLFYLYFCHDYFSTIALNCLHLIDYKLLTFLLQVKG